MAFPFENNELSLEERLEDLMSRLTVEEKIGFLPGEQDGVPRLGIKPFISWREAAHGVVDRDGAKATVFPQPFGLSSTWDCDLMKEIGSAIGDEARVLSDQVGGQDHQICYFPTIDMVRDPRWGRNEEAYGEDPYLAGKLAAQLIQGAQGDDPFYVKICVSPKHFYANTFDRDRAFTNSVVPESSKWDYYLKVFSYAFEEGHALSVMACYNKVNGIPGMLNPELDTVIRDKWGCEGFFSSDGGAVSQVVTEHKYFKTHAETIEAGIKAGLNSFGDEANYVKQSAREAYERGLITEADLDRALRPMFRVRFRLGHFDADKSKNPYAHISSDVLCSENHAALARKASQEAVVLLKNDGILPLDPEKTRTLAVIGQLGIENLMDWYSGYPPYDNTVLDGLKKAFPDTSISYTDGCDNCAFYSERTGGWLKVLPDGSISLDASETDRSVFRVSDWGYGGFGYRELKTGNYLTTHVDGTLWCDAKAFWGWFTRELFFRDGDRFVLENPQQGSSLGVAIRVGDSIYNKPYEAGCVDKINEVLAGLRIKTLSDGLEEVKRISGNADAVVVVVGNHTMVGARECIDRENLDLPERMDALLKTAEGVNKNIILSVIAGYPYALESQEKLSRAVLFTTHGEQEVGFGIAGAIAGEFSPAGRLSMTWYHDSSDFPDINDYDIVKNKRTYLFYDKPVLHPFGYGLSYTDFNYTDFSLEKKEDGFVVSFSVKNIGNRDSDEVPQVYVSSGRTDIPRPNKQLCGFKRIFLKAGEEQRLSFTVPMKELKYYDLETGSFVVDSGVKYRFMAGPNSDDLLLYADCEME